jgi:hypothetical protein
MITFAMLILEKMRFILLLEHSASSKESITERVSPDDLEFIELQAAKRTLTTAMLVSMLEATDRIGRARIEQLPLEMAVVEVCGE